MKHLCFLGTRSVLLKEGERAQNGIFAALGRCENIEGVFQVMNPHEKGNPPALINQGGFAYPRVPNVLLAHLISTNKSSQSRKIHYRKAIKIRVA